MGLVDYSSGSDGGSDTEAQDVGAKRRKVEASPTPSSKDSTPSATSSAAAQPKRRLPSLPRSYSGISSDDSAAHQGRVRARPFVDGDYYAHVYVELDVSPELRAVLDGMGAAAGAGLGVRVHSLLQGQGVGARESAGSGAETEPDAPLHVSLSHPLPLRRPLARSFARQVAAALAGQRAFAVSLVAHPTLYRNAPREGPRRAFLALRAGAGTPDLRALLARVEALLRREHLPLYHAEPEFHASFAWWLDTGAEPNLAALTEHAGRARELLREAWRVAHVCVKVAKEVTRVPLL